MKKLIFCEDWSLSAMVALPNKSNKCVVIEND